MTAETLRAVALDVIDDYRRVAKSAGAVFRRGSIKGFSKADSTVGALMSNYEHKVGKNLKKSISSAHQHLTTASTKADKSVGKLGSMMRDGIHGTQKKVVAAAHRSESMVDKVLGGASRMVSTYPAKNTLVGRILTSPVVAAVEPLGLPGVRLLRYASSKIAHGAEKSTEKFTSAKTTAPKKRLARAKKTAKRATGRRK